MQQRGVSVAEVARHASVSNAAVSNYLAGRHAKAGGPAVKNIRHALRELGVMPQPKTMRERIREKYLAFHRTARSYGVVLHGSGQDQDHETLFEMGVLPF